MVEWSLELDDSSAEVVEPMSKDELSVEKVSDPLERDGSSAANEEESETEEEDPSWMEDSSAELDMDSFGREDASLGTEDS